MRKDVVRRQLRDLNRRRAELTDLLASLERVRVFVDEHGEADRDVMLDSLHCYSQIAVHELVHLCRSADRINAEAGFADGQWRHFT